MATLLEARDLVTNFYTYEGVVQALDRVSLVVDHGTTFGLVGESGCGKSVSVRSIMRIVPAPGRIEDGKVLFFFDDRDRARGVELLAQSEAAMETLRGNRLSMIFQEPNAALNPIMTIGEQVAESFLFHRQEAMSRRILADLEAEGGASFNPLNRLQRRLYATAAQNPKALALRILDRLPLTRRWQARLRQEALARAVEIIGKLGIPNPREIVGRYPHNLSGGMKQRIVIAIALACSPHLLIADEATSNLDVTIQAQILDLLRQLKRTEIASILLITHDLGVVAETCNRVGVMYAGQLCEVADVADLFEAPRHPYTRALLDAVPRMDQEGALKSIAGRVPNLVTPPPGCRFHPRCPAAMPACRRRFPETVAVGPQHAVACYLYTDQPRAPGQEGSAPP
ncbi:MAG: ABC transporter ATP-binding protein [Desulfobacterales bacterium]|jgi:peptide/nickel transport system ATP-binding protein